jgi:hypothetical protein
MSYRVPFKSCEAQANDDKPNPPDHHHGLGTTGAAGVGAGVGTSVGTVPITDAGAAAVGTAEVPITGIFEQIDARERPFCIGAKAPTALVASTNICPQFGLAQT